MIDAWKDTGHVVTSEMEGRKSEGLLTECAWRMGVAGALETSSKELYDGLKGSEYELSMEEITNYGFWHLTKKIVREIMPVGRDLDIEPLIIFSGHSQGGARSNLVSMWLEKEDGKKYKSIALSPIGVQCFSRKYANMGHKSANLLDDVDPYIFHDQITSYLHPLDIYSGIDFNPGKVCQSGNTLFGTDRPGGKDLEGHFAKMVGYSGTLLNLDIFNAVPSGHFQQARYWVHSITFLNILFADEEFLTEDGAIDGGCVNAEIIPEADPEGKCPTGKSTEPMCNVLLGGAVFVFVLFLTLMCCVCCFCAKVGPFKKKGETKVVPG